MALALGRARTSCADDDRHDEAINCASTNQLAKSSSQKTGRACGKKARLQHFASDGPRTSEHTRHDHGNNRLHHQLRAKHAHGGDWRAQPQLSSRVHQGLSNKLGNMQAPEAATTARLKSGARTSYARLSRAIRRTEACSTPWVATFRKNSLRWTLSLGHARRSRLTEASAAGKGKHMSGKAGKQDQPSAAT